MSNVKVNNLSIKTPKLTFSPGKGVHVDFSGIDLSASLHWHYKEHIWPHLPEGSGTADVKAGSNTYVRCDLVTSMTNGKPHFTLSNTDINIDDFSIKVHGSILSWLYDLIVDAFKVWINMVAINFRDFC